MEQAFVLTMEAAGEVTPAAQRPEVEESSDSEEESHG